MLIVNPRLAEYNLIALSVLMLGETFDYLLTTDLRRFEIRSQARQVECLKCELRAVA
jgi:hypothetical protein